MARGDVTPSQANEIARPIDAFMKTLIAARIEINVADLQKSLGEGEFWEDAVRRLLALERRTFELIKEFPPPPSRFPIMLRDLSKI